MITPTDPSAENPPAPAPVDPSTDSAEPPTSGSEQKPDQGSVWEVFRAFLLLGFTSFGGPVAHIGFFREAFTVQRAWLSDRAFADLVALCQFLPGPASSQVGFAIGLHRAGLKGAAAAFTAFTLPSALAMGVIGVGSALAPTETLSGLLSGLKIVALAVVAQAVLGMARSLCPDRPRATLAIAASAVVLLWPLSGLPLALGQLAPILLGGLIGWALFTESGQVAPSASETDAKTADDAFRVPIGRRTGLILIAAVPALLILLPAIASLSGSSVLAFLDAIFRSGALVFGGGHVVLPLLQGAVVDVGSVSEPVFLAGYGAAQAMPGPLFTIASHLGAAAGAAGTVPGGAVLLWLGATLAIFLPGFLLLLGALPFWAGLRENQRMRGILTGVNAAVVGLLAAALYDPVFTAAVATSTDMALALLAFLALHIGKLPPWLVVLVGAALGWFIL